MFIICIVAAAAAGLRGASRVRGARAPHAGPFGVRAPRSPRARPHDCAVRVRTRQYYVLRYYGRPV